MTREEAISIMKVIVHMLEEKYDTDRVEEAVDMAISALSEKDWKFYYDHGYAQAKRDLSENKGDLINRQAVLDAINTDWHEDLSQLEDAIKALPPVEPKTGWIPIETRPLTNKEKEEYADLGYSEDSIDSMYDCPLPEDGEEVLITTRYDEVTTDTFYRDEGCYFETYCDKDDVKAWMPLPEPYKEEGSEE